jgi:hypothetical protein
VIRARWALAATAAVAVAVAAQQALLWSGFGHRFALYRPSTWRDLTYAELIMSSRGLAVATMLTVAAFAVTLAVQLGRPGAVPMAGPFLAGVAVLGCLLMLTGFVRLVYKTDRILDTGVPPETIPTVPFTGAG